ncbi:hypothetical protein GpartN1_g1777.t1 [Galdieria partita]|uniref:Class I SAM-dependent methyltransferase n=1 Tax=Galdieria partita TaxID=83374 RepID=A0A9C7UNY4_9RHOD|nr:hypothetical protein GpartN1_g1777.t1 [Galdieria partita]
MGLTEGSRVERLPWFNQSFSNVEEWFDTETGKFFMKTICEYDFPRGSFVEIGSWQGRSSCFIATALKYCKQYEKLHCIDTFNGTTNEQVHRDIFKAHGDDPDWLFRTFQNNLKSYELETQVIIHRLPSTEAVKTWNSPIGFIYIDGDHEYEAILQDFESCQILVRGALLAFDDVPS